MQNLEQGILKAIGGAIENHHILGPELLKKIQDQNLLLAGSSAAQILFGREKPIRKPRLIKLIKPTEYIGPSTVVEKEGITAKIYKVQDYGDHEILEVEILKGDATNLAQIFTLNLEQIIIDFKKYKVHYTDPFMDFYRDKQIKIINFIAPQLFLRKLKELNHFSSVGHLNIHHERQIGLLFFFFHFKLNFKKNPEMRAQLTDALIELSKKVDINLFRKSHLSPQDLFFLLRLALETSTKKSKRIFQILSQKRYAHLTSWAQNSVPKMNTLFQQDLSPKKLKEVSTLLYLPYVKAISKNYSYRELGLHHLIDDLSFIYKKSYKDLTITQNTLIEYLRKFPEETLKNAQTPTIWEELHAIEEINYPIFPEGVTVRKLKTTNDLILEGKRMKHCLGKIRRFSDGEERHFFSLNYRGEDSTIEIQRNVKGSTTEPSIGDLLSEFERMLGGGIPDRARNQNEEGGRIERDDLGYLTEVAPEAHYIFSIRGKCNKIPSEAHQQIAKVLCQYLDSKCEKLKEFRKSSNQDKRDESTYKAA